MARILITSGPTRQYLDPVRYLTNGSSGRMGCALTSAALALGHHVVVISGPVEVEYPSQAEVVRVITTDEMLAACLQHFPKCEGLIAAAAPCDYRPERVASHKISKTGRPLELHLVETPDIVATLGLEKSARQWLVGFALETKDQRIRAQIKLEKKSCDLMVVNGLAAMHARDTNVEIIDRRGQVVDSFQGSKDDVARGILQVIDLRLIQGAWPEGPT
jgi:phosphopantothenoylcysteine decarboxylase / phosphopantothenate---cysteine ligase